jgi:hypothetical protein
MVGINFVAYTGWVGAKKLNNSYPIACFIRFIVSVK